MNHVKKFLLPLLVLAATISLAACGGGGSGNRTIAGTFETLPGASAAYSKLAGDAELTRSGDGTRAEIELSGLEPDTAYVAHLHTGGCAQPDAGGPHFQFKKGGSEKPPNEIHFDLTTDAKGNGTAKATNDREVPAGEAGSIVLHLADDHGTAMAGSHHSELAALFVHEGEHHEEGDDHGEDGAGDDHGGEQHSHSDEIACAELEGGGSSASVPTIVVRDGEPIGGIEQLEYSAGEQIRFKVSGDEAEEIHVHGYDLMKDIPAGGGTVEFDFPAEIEGIFEAELEGKGVQILELTVNP